MTLQQAYEQTQAACGIKVGDKVKVLRLPESGECGWHGSFIEGMRPYLTDTLNEVEEVHHISGYRIGSFWWPWFVLEVVETPITIRFQGEDFPVQFESGFIKVGCTAVPNSVVEAINERLVR